MPKIWKKEKPTVTTEPLRNCVNCINWKSKAELEGKDHADYMSGRCFVNGYQCGPRWLCKRWESGSGTILDNLRSFER